MAVMLKINQVTDNEANFILKEQNKHKAYFIDKDNLFLGSMNTDLTDTLEDSLRVLDKSLSVGQYGFIEGQREEDEGYVIFKLNFKSENLLEDLVEALEKFDKDEHDVESLYLNDISHFVLLDGFYLKLKERLEKSERFYLFVLDNKNGMSEQDKLRLIGEDTYYGIYAYGKKYVMGNFLLSEKRKVNVEIDGVVYPCLLDYIKNSDDKSLESRCYRYWKTCIEQEGLDGYTGTFIRNANYAPVLYCSHDDRLGIGCNPILSSALGVKEIDDTIDVFRESGNILGRLIVKLNKDLFGKKLWYQGTYL